MGFILPPQNQRFHNFIRRNFRFNLSSCGLKTMAEFITAKVLFIRKQSISLRDGEIVIDEPNRPFELWIFCEVPFVYYNGSIQITTSCGTVDIVNVRRYSPWLMWLWRSELYGRPIIWHPPKSKSSTGVRYVIKFNLLPTFTDSTFDEVIHAGDVQLVTCLVKGLY